MGVVASIKYAVKAAANYHKQGAKKNIFLFASPRGGSTWLMEIIASQPGVKYYDEPLNVRRDNVQRTGVLTSWDQLMPEAAQTERILDYLGGLTVNRYRLMNPPPFRRNHRLFTDRVVFKIHEIEHLINVVRDQLQGTIVFLLRHPIPTTISRKQFPRLEGFMKSPSFLTEILSPAQRKGAEEVFAKGDVFEQGVLCWCFQNVMPLNVLDHKDWTILTYEELVLRPAEICRLLCDRLELEDLGRMLSAAGLASTNIVMSHDDTHRALSETDESKRKAALVTKWRKRVSPEQERRAMEIVSMLGLDAYAQGEFLATDKYLCLRDTRRMFEAMIGASEG